MQSTRRLGVLVLILFLPVVQTATAHVVGATPQADPFPFQYSAVVASLLSQVQQLALYNQLQGITGEMPITVGGESVTLTTRNTESSNISAATTYAYQFFQLQGLITSYHEWEGYSDYGDWLTGQNVVAEIHGSRRPQEIVLIAAHLDDINEDGSVESRAPGADDNASGALAVMTAADLLAGHTFDRTLRFLLFTGEEQGLVGSAGYARDSKAAGENVVAVLNMDMIAWDDNDDGALYLETRRTTSAGYAADLAIANVFLQVISSYGLNSALEPHIDPCSDAYVDSWSFWSVGIPSVTAIEDWDWEELNPYPHTAGDTVSTLNLQYYTYNVQAVVGTAAHLALLVDAIDYDHPIYLPLVYKKYLG